MKDVKQTKRCDLQVDVGNGSMKQVVFKTPPLDYGWPVRVVSGTMGLFCSMAVKKSYNASASASTFDSEGFVTSNHDFNTFIESVFHPKCVEALPDIFFDNIKNNSDPKYRQMIREAQIPCPAKSDEKNSHGVMTSIRVNFSEAGELVALIAKFTGYIVDEATGKRKREYKQLNPTATINPGQFRTFFTVHAYRQASGKCGLVLTAQQIYVEKEHNTSLSSAPMESSVDGEEIVFTKPDLASESQPPPPPSTATPPPPPQQQTSSSTPTDPPLSPASNPSLPDPATQENDDDLVESSRSKKRQKTDKQVAWSP